MRRAPQIAAALERSLEQVGFGPGGRDSLRHALVQIAARFGEIVAEHIDAAPDAHRVAFTQMLGVAPRTAKAAHTYLVFKPAAGGGPDVPVVPMHTRVAASRGVGKDPPVF